MAAGKVRGLGPDTVIQCLPAGPVGRDHQWRGIAAIERPSVIQHRGMAAGLTAQQIDRRVIPRRAAAVKEELLTAGGDLRPQKAGAFRIP